MKKIILLVSVLILSASGISAQLSLGVKAGYNMSLALDVNRNSDALSINLKEEFGNGFHVGFYGRIGRSLYLQPELLYNYSVYNQRLGVGDIDLNYNVKKIVASTFDVPLLLGYSIINTSFFKFRVMAGPKFSFNAGSTKVEDFGSIHSMPRAARVGLDAGLGLDVWRLSLDLRYNFIGSLYKYNNINNEEKINTDPNHAFTLSLGFRILGNNNKR